MPANLIAEGTQGTSLGAIFVRAAPLPRRAQPPVSAGAQKRYEVLVIGAGPSGLMLTTILTRYGLPAASLLCVDARQHQTLIGNADGMSARTLEIFAQLGLEGRVRRHGTPFAESTIWGNSPENLDKLGKLAAFPFNMAPARYEEVTALHQGHIEQIFRDDLALYGANDVQYSTKLMAMRLDDSDKDFPVLATIEQGGVQEEVRAKYLVGADGARSSVRDFMGVKMEGSMTQELWGVIDVVVDTDFPDIRRLAHFNTSAGLGHQSSKDVRGGFIVPRERLPNGDYLTRFYLDMTIVDEEENTGTNMTAEDQRRRTKEKRSQITEALILDRAAKLLRPYRFGVKKGTTPQWWAAFPIAQNLASTFTLKDSFSHPRVIIVGDACHSHSPRQGQGMNVSMQDSYNLGWKLAYTILGLDNSEEGAKLLENYEEERLPNAKNLISFDKRMNQENRPLEEKMADLKQFSTNCGVEYGNGLCVDKADFRTGQTWNDEDYLSGIIRPGRRLLNCKVKRFADGNPRDIHDELRAEGRLSIVMLAGDDFGIKDGRSNNTADEICDRVIKLFPPGIVQPIVIQPNSNPTFQWTDLPPSTKREAEMSLHNASTDVYELYGVEHVGPQAGALVVVRPDGVVGMIAVLEGVERVVEFLTKIIRTV